MEQTLPKIKEDEVPDTELIDDVLRGLTYDVKRRYKLVSTIYDPAGPWN